VRLLLTTEGVLDDVRSIGTVEAEKRATEVPGVVVCHVRLIEGTISTFTFWSLAALVVALNGLNPSTGFEVSTMSPPVSEANCWLLVEPLVDAVSVVAACAAGTISFPGPPVLGAPGVEEAVTFELAVLEAPFEVVEVEEAVLLEEAEAVEDAVTLELVASGCVLELEVGPPSTVVVIGGAPTVVEDDDPTDDVEEADELVVELPLSGPPVLGVPGVEEGAVVTDAVGLGNREKEKDDVQFCDPP